MRIRTTFVTEVETEPFRAGIAELPSDFHNGQTRSQPAGPTFSSP